MKYQYEVWEDNEGGVYLFILDNDDCVVWGAGDYRKIGRRFLQYDINLIKQIHDMSVINSWEYGTLETFEEVEQKYNEIKYDGGKWLEADYIHLME